MSIKPNEIIEKLSKEDQLLLSRILQVEKNRLHIRDLKPSSRNEKEIIEAIINEVDQVVKDEN